MDIFLLGYGTLLNQGSLGHSIGQDAAGAKRIVPAVVHGYRRLFNLRPTHYESSSKFSDEGIENAAMNVEPAEGSYFNGLGFAVTEEELRELDQRESYYVRETAPLVAFGTGEEIGEGHIYVGKDDSPYLERDTNLLMPLWRDVVWARVGAYRISDDFGRMFDATTYLADGTTPVVDAYREHLRDISDVEMPG